MTRRHSSDDFESSDELHYRLLNHIPFYRFPNNCILTLIMQFIGDEIYHVYNRGNNKQPIFFNRENYLFFLSKIRKELIPYCNLISYCLMPNHFHLEVCIKSSKSPHQMISSHPINKSFSDGLAVLLRSYTRAIQKQERITGSLFQQKTKARLLSGGGTNETMNDILICMNYIHQNPLKAKLVKSIHEWEFSSYRDYANLRSGTLCNKKLGFELTGLRENSFIEESHEMTKDYFILIESQQ